jgi:DNA-binding transcriptional LysR family regulator
MDSLRSISIFVSAVHRGNFSAAGRELGLSPAAISRAVSELERKLGAKLLNRTSRTMSLTEAGALYFSHAEAILQQVAEAEGSVSSATKKASGTLRVHAWSLLGSRFVSPLVPQFLQKYPEIKVQLFLSNSSVNLAEQNIDLDIRFGRLSEGDLMVRKLGETEWYVIASPSYLDSSTPLEKPADLKHHNCIAYTLAAGGPNWSFVDSSGRRSDIEVKGSFQTDYGPSLLDAVTQDLGVALMPEWAIRKELASGQVRRVLTRYVASQFGYETGIYVLLARNKYTPAKTRLFISFLANSFRSRSV